MLAILSAILGFAGPFIPEVIKLFRQKADNAHELAWSADAKAQLAESSTCTAWRKSAARLTLPKCRPCASRSRASACRSWTPTHWPKMVILPVFYLFAVLDFINGIIRPGVTSCMVGFYLAFKWSQYRAGKVRMGDYAQAVQAIWSTTTAPSRCCAWGLLRAPNHEGCVRRQHQHQQGWGGWAWRFDSAPRLVGGGGTSCSSAAGRRHPICGWPRGAGGPTPPDALIESFEAGTSAVPTA